MASKINHISVGGVPYDLAAQPDKNSITSDMLTTGIADGTTIGFNEYGQLTVIGSNALIGVDDLDESVWTKVREEANTVMETGFGEILNGSY